MLAERYYEALEAPQGNELVWFEDSAHLTYAEEPATRTLASQGHVHQSCYPHQV